MPDTLKYLDKEGTALLWERIVERDNTKQDLIRFDTTAGWRENLTFVPANGEIIIYTDRATVNGANVPGIKIGDGTTYGIDLPFVGDDIAANIMSILQAHVSNTDVHVTPQEKQFWNNKINCGIQDEVLVINRL